MTQQYKFILIFCNKAHTRLRGFPCLLLNPAQRHLYVILHTFYSDNIEFTSENINKFSVERIWENLFGNSSSRAYTSSFTQSLAHVEEHNYTSSKGDKLCFHNCTEKNGTKINASILRDNETSRQKLLWRLHGNTFLTHGTVWNKTIHLPSLRSSPV